MFEGEGWAAAANVSSLQLGLLAAGPYWLWGLPTTWYRGMYIVAPRGGWHVASTVPDHPFMGRLGQR